MVFNCRIPRNGDKVTKKKFAFFPVRIDLDKVIWWEWYYKTSEFIEGPGWSGWISKEIKRVTNESK